jgi:GAF domain-containing protein
MTDYTALRRELEALTEGVPHAIANLANASALIRQRLEELNWAGFYLMQDGKLVLGPFQGKPACIEIAPGRGVCGTAVQRREPVLVPDVHAFPGHIACDGDSRSELVIPIFRGEEVWGVLDLDSPREGRFTEADREGLEACVRTLERALFPGV